MARYPLELDLQYPWLAPFAVHTEFDFSHDRVKGCASRVCGKAVVIESAGRFDGLSNHLKLCVGQRRHVVPEKIDARFTGACLVGIQELLHTRERHLWNGLPVFVVDEAVEQRAERCFYPCILRAVNAS